VVYNGGSSQYLRDHTRNRSCVIIVLAVLVRDLSTAPYQPEELLIEDGHVEQHHAMRVQSRLKGFVQLRGGVLGNVIDDSLFSELRPKCEAGVSVTDDS